MYVWGGLYFLSSLSFTIICTQKWLPLVAMMKSHMSFAETMVSVVVKRGSWKLYKADTIIFTSQCYED